MKKAKKVFYSFILFTYIGATTICSAPITHPFVNSIRNFINPTLTLLGLGQSWDMFRFARRFNVSVNARIQLSDGSRVQWDLPKMEELSTWEKYKKERYRKYANDNLFYLSSDLASFNFLRYVANDYFQNTGKVPDRIYLNLCQSFIPPPDDPKIFPQWIIPPPDWRCRTIYNIRPRPGEYK